MKPRLRGRPRNFTHNRGRPRVRPEGVAEARDPDAAIGHHLRGLTGIGTAGTAVLGVVLFQEAVSALRVVFISLIAIGILGLKTVP